MPITSDAPYGVVTELVSGSGALNGSKRMSVPCSGRQPPAFDISRYFCVLSCTSSTAKSSGQGWVTACSVIVTLPYCLGPPGGSRVIVDGYGEPGEGVAQPAFSIGTAIGVGFHSAVATPVVSSHTSMPAMAVSTRPYTRCVENRCVAPVT